MCTCDADSRHTTHHILLPSYRLYNMAVILYIGASHFAARPANLPRIILALALYPIGKQTSSPAKAVQGTHQAEAYSVGSAASSFKAQRKLMGTSLSSVRGRSNCTSDLMPMSTRLTSRREM